MKVKNEKEEIRYTVSGIPVKPVYTKEDADNKGMERPGEYPFTRGLYPSMYRTTALIS